MRAARAGKPRCDLDALRADAGGFAQGDDRRRRWRLRIASRAGATRFAQCGPRVRVASALTRRARAVGRMPTLPLYPPPSPPPASALGPEAGVSVLAPMRMIGPTGVETSIPNVSACVRACSCFCCIVWTAVRATSDDCSMEEAESACWMLTPARRPIRMLPGRGDVVAQLSAAGTAARAPVGLGEICANSEAAESRTRPLLPVCLPGGAGAAPGQMISVLILCWTNPA